MNKAKPNNTCLSSFRESTKRMKKRLHLSWRHTRRRRRWLRRRYTTRFRLSVWSTTTTASWRRLTACGPWGWRHSLKHRKGGYCCGGRSGLGELQAQIIIKSTFTWMLNALTYPKHITTNESQQINSLDWALFLQKDKKKQNFNRNFKERFVERKNH